VRQFRTLKILAHSLLFVLGVVDSAYCAPPQVNFTPITYSGANYTHALGINNAGQVVGFAYSIPNHHYTGFLLNAGNYSNITIPGSTASTIANGINNNGQIVGYDMDDSVGFVLSAGTFTRISVPGATWTVPRGINDQGQIVGDYEINGQTYGFLYSGGAFTTLTIPSAINISVSGINNNGQAVGWFWDSGHGSHAFSYSSGKYTTFDFPNAGGTIALGINSGGQIVGQYVDSGYYYGYVLSAGTFTTFAVSTVSTSGTGINDNGQIVGIASIGGSEIGFLTTVPIRTGVLSHIAAGGGWNTVITLVNNSAVALPVAVALHNDDGSSLSLPVTVTQQGTSQTITASTVNVTIHPKGSALISTGDGISSTSVGWADVSSPGPLGGFAIFRSTPGSGPPSEGTVLLQSQFPSTITLPYDNTAGFVMGAAMANLSASAANVTATIWDDTGKQLGTQNLTIAGSGHMSFALPNLIPLTAGRRGIVQFETAAGGGLAGLGLRFSPFGTFTSVPTM
jgi:probable HAF family extracellular repeat protein